MGDSNEGGVESEYATYEDFLDSQIASVDLYYLEDEELARQLVELGYRGSGEAVKREEFEQKKQSAEAARAAKRSAPKPLSHTEYDWGESIFLTALAEREQANRNGKMMSILFIRDINSKGQEISGYIDLAHRLKNEEFGVYFSRKKKLLPKSTDLSFYNWATQTAKSKSSPNYQVVADKYPGLLFKNRRDRKILNVDPKQETPGDNSTRHVLFGCDEYLQVVFYDHVTRGKA